MISPWPYLKVALAIAVGVVLTCVMPLQAKAETGGYPYATFNGPGTNASQFIWTNDAGGMYSPYGFAYRNCTDFVAWKLATANSYSIPVPQGSSGAADWGIPAHNGGFTPNDVPAPGSVAWWNGSTPGTGGFGHVAWVESVSPDGNNVTIQEYNNPAGSGAYNRRQISRNAASGYIHFKDLGPGGGAPQASLPDGQVVENLDTSPRFHYVAAGGRLFWYDRDNAAQESAFIGQMHAKLGANAQVRPMYGEEVHPIEANYPTGAAHRPANNSFMKEYGNDTVYMIQYDYAFPINSMEELGYLGGESGKITVVPPGSIGPLRARADVMPNIANARVLKARDIPEYYEIQDGQLYWMDNFTVLDCVVRYKGGAVQQVPDTLIQKFIEVGRKTGQISHCGYPPDVAIYGTGGVERWYIYGTNPYNRYQYASVFDMQCRIGGDPRQMEISREALNQAADAHEFLRCPDNSYVKNRQNGEVYRVLSGTLHYVQSYDTLRCLVGGTPGEPTGIDELVLSSVPRGSDASCTYEGKLIRSPEGNIYWVKDSQRHYIGNMQIVNCIRVRAAAGDPVPVPQSTINDYSEGYGGYCPYPSEVRFVRGEGQSQVWRVYTDGTRQHALSLCVANAEDPSTDLRYRVFVMPAGEVDGHRLRDPDTWSASPEACAAIS